MRTLPSALVLSLRKKLRLPDGVQCLSFEQLRALGLAAGESWEREIEMALDRLHPQELVIQFFQDARGPRLGYSGAVDCLEGYVGQGNLTGESFAKVKADVEEVLARAGVTIGAVFDADDSHLRLGGEWFRCTDGTLENDKSVIAECEAHVSTLEVEFDGVGYAKRAAGWVHAATGKPVRPVNADGSPMTPSKFADFLSDLDAALEYSNSSGG